MKNSQQVITSSTCTFRTFRVYDLNGDGVITKTELGNVLVAVSELMGIDMKPPVSIDLQTNVFFFCQFSYF